MVVAPPRAAVIIQAGHSEASSPGGWPVSGDPPKAILPEDGGT